MQKKTYNNGNLEKQADYISNFIYKNAKLSFILIGVGRLVSDSFGFEINNLAFTTSPQQETAHRYLYNSKELQDDFGLSWYDYGTRFYAPIVPHFLTIDPLAEKCYSLSPYNYVAGNPIRFIDLDGRDIWITYQEEKDIIINLEKEKVLSKKLKQLHAIKSIR